MVTAKYVFLSFKTFLSIISRPTNLLVHMESGKQDNNKTSWKDSSLWRNLYNTVPHLLETRIWYTGDGVKTVAWEECWIEPGCCIADVDLHIPVDLYGMKVCDLANESGDWKWNLLQWWLPAGILDKIRAIKPLATDNGADRFMLAGSGDGAYS